ncbi:MAG: hypothetical protein LBR68_02775 [Lachnoclostridium sp.]|jgi:hypothetical protein|nr:hypothetical protein [Lachnoclostridium sp.]
MGAGGGVKIESIWDGDRLLTIIIIKGWNWMFHRKTYDSFTELEKDSLELGFKIYGDCDEYSNKFELISLTDKGCNCGVVYYDHGIGLQVLPLNGTVNLLIGFEKSIVGINCITKSELVQKKSISLFYEFLETPEFVVAVCELDLYVFDKACKLLWSSGFRDIIEDYKVLNDGVVSVQCSNGDKLEFDLKTGTTLR